MRMKIIISKKKRKKKKMKVNRMNKMNKKKITPQIASYKVIMKKI